MKARLTIAIAAAAGALSLVAHAGNLPLFQSSDIMMVPGAGLSLDVGNTRVVSYFEPKDGACTLTLVMANLDGGVTGADSPGTRVKVSVAPLNKLEIDDSHKRSAEFICGPGGKKMSARVHDREAYKGAKT